MLSHRTRDYLKDRILKSDSLIQYQFRRQYLKELTFTLEVLKYSLSKSKQRMQKKIETREFYSRLETLYRAHSLIVLISSRFCQALTCNSAGSRRPGSEGDQRLGGTRPLKSAFFQIQLFSLLVLSNYIYIDSLYTSLIITNKLISSFIRQLTGRRKI